MHATTTIQKHSGRGWMFVHILKHSEFEAHQTGAEFGAFQMYICPWPKSEILGLSAIDTCKLYVYLP